MSNNGITAYLFPKKKKILLCWFERERRCRLETLLQNCLTFTIGQAKIMCKNYLGGERWNFNTTQQCDKNSEFIFLKRSEKSRIDEFKEADPFDRISNPTSKVVAKCR